jgi:diaminopimelate epimerase
MSARPWFDRGATAWYTTGGMDLEFIKMQLAGRDAVLLDAARHTGIDADFLAGAAAVALDRRHGIGAESLLLVTRGKDHDVEVRSFSRRGEEEEPTLNELMCAGRYAIDSGLASGTTTLARGPVRSVVLDALVSWSVLADVGSPRSQEGRELVESPEVSYTRTVRLDGKDFTFTPVVVGPYHAVAFVQDYDLDLRRLSRDFRGEVLESESGGPATAEHAELTCARASSRRRLLARTWRYGHGEVRSEGYAAAAVAVAAALHGFSDRDTIVTARGGELYVYWSETDNHLYVTGSPEYVFTGTYSIGERQDGGQAF